VAHITGSPPLFPYPFWHNTTLQHHRLLSGTRWSLLGHPSPRDGGRVVLPLLGGPTQVGTTPSLAFRALLLGKRAELEMVL
jgi:hypothetical protein